ncbi:hypothetical protein MRS44_017504 [Fusarium solani]|uniref:uncharacterized protein n=1 Tax=Fusarium solani TaxID=169388 RepID=UPI0032C48B4C|nr:hypothetical protein MRS44_017504 [Fusarium solani]
MPAIPASYIGHLRPFDHTQVDETAPLPRVFQGVEEWSEHIQSVSMQLFRPGSHLAVDECIIRYTGRSDAITTIKGKPDPVGFKIWVIAQMGFFIQWLWHIKEAEQGAVGVEISTQKRKVSVKAAERAPDTGDNDDAVNSTQAVVIGLTRTLPKSTYHVFVDNLFSSPPLFRNLRKQGYGATGTARTNSGIHEELVRDKNDDGKVQKNVNQIAWKDNKLVLFLTTVFTGADDERVIRQRKKPSSKKSEAKPIRCFFGDEAVKMINIPTVAAAYNDEMNHVDRGDQLRSYYKYDHRLRRGAWQALAWTFLLDVALVNSYVAQLHGQPNWKRFTNHREWRECIYNELFNAYGYDSQARRRYQAGDERDLQTPELQREHVNREINHIDRHVKSDCLACQRRRQGQVRAKGQEWAPLTEEIGSQRPPASALDAASKSSRTKAADLLVVSGVSSCDAFGGWMLGEVVVEKDAMVSHPPQNHENRSD